MGRPLYEAGVVSREQIERYLQNTATRISKIRSTTLSLHIDELFACMRMAKSLLDAEDITVDENWIITIKGGRVS